jgi:hypothetical protein
MARTCNIVALSYPETQRSDHECEREKQRPSWRHLYCFLRVRLEAIAHA